MIIRNKKIGDDYCRQSSQLVVLLTWTTFLVVLLLFVFGLQCTKFAMRRTFFFIIHLLYPPRILKRKRRREGWVLSCPCCRQSYHWTVQNRTSINPCFINQYSIQQAWILSRPSEKRSNFFFSSFFYIIIFALHCCYYYLYQYTCIYLY